VGWRDTGLRPANAHRRAPMAGGMGDNGGDFGLAVAGQALLMVVALVICYIIQQYTVYLDRRQATVMVVSSSSSLSSGGHWRTFSLAILVPSWVPTVGRPSRVVGLWLTTMVRPTL
jgi:hypothetical protein